MAVEWRFGDRLAQIRQRRGQSQTELAGRVGLSPDYISKIERGERDGLTVATFCELVDALDMEIKIVDKSGAGGAEDDVREQDRELVLPLRRLLLPVARAGGSVDEAGLTPAGLRRRVLECTADFNRARYAKLGAEIPALVVSIEAAVGLHEGEAKEDLYRLLANAYILTAQTVMFLRDESLACVAVGRAVDAAENAGDPVLRALAAKNYTLAFMRQGMLDDAEAVAVDLADEMGEPSMKKPDPGHLAVWGELHRLASRAAALNNRPDVAEELLRLAHMAAVRVDGGEMDYGKYWEVFSLATVGITRTGNALVRGDAALALRIGAGVRPTPNLHVDWWTYHLRTRADAQAATRDYAGAVETMKSVRRLAPEWVKNDRDAHEVVLRLLDATSVRRARSSGLVELARFMEVKP